MQSLYTYIQGEIIYEILNTTQATSIVPWRWSKGVENSNESDT